MKILVFRVFNLTFGRLIRLCQKTLTPPNKPQQGLFHLIWQQSLQDSAQYALDTLLGPCNLRLGKNCGVTV